MHQASSSHDQSNPSEIHPSAGRGIYLSSISGPRFRTGRPHTMAAADAEMYSDARDEQAKHVVRLAEVVVRGASDLVHNLLRTSAELSEHEAIPFLSTAGCIVRLVIQHAEAVGENDEYVREAGRRARAVQVSAKICRGFVFTHCHWHSLTAASLPLPSSIQAVITTLEGAGFPQQHPCYVSILDSLAEIEGQC